MFSLSALPTELGNTRLRGLSPRDAAAFASGTDDDLVKKFAHLPHRSYTEAFVREMIEGEVAEGLRRGDLAVLAIADRKSDEFAGCLVIFDVTSKAAELGFWLSARHRGRGLARSAIELGAQFARASGITTLRARTVPDNPASMSALTSRGFTEVGTSRGTAPSDQEIDLVSFERTMAPGPTLPLGTARLTLRPYRYGDTDWMGDVYGDAEIVRFLLHEPLTREDAAAEVAKRSQHVDLDGTEGIIALVIEAGGEPVGDISLTMTDVARRTAEIGWTIAPWASGRGYGTEAARAMLDLAFRHYRVHRVVAQMDARNSASAALAARVGMRREAHHLQDWWNKGEWTDTLIFAQLASGHDVAN